jgi:hypothetical protein
LNQQWCEAPIFSAVSFTGRRHPAGRLGIGVLTGRVAAKILVAAGIECPEGIARVGSVARACMASPEQEAFMLQLKTGDAL